MKELPILMKAPMVCATLRDVDPKSQTRRIMKPQPEGEPRPLSEWSAGLAAACGDHSPDPDKLVAHQQRLEGLVFPFTTPGGGLVSWPCPYGQPGDRLWVRETFFAWGYWETRFSEKKGRDEWHFVDITLESAKHYRYAATDTADSSRQKRSTHVPRWWKRTAIHMPRVASRITLEITGVRVERLQDISEVDSIAEGIERVGDKFKGYLPTVHDGLVHDLALAKTSYAQLWEQINGPGSWAANPYVWVLEFKRIKP